MAILPWTSWVNKMRLDAVVTEPTGDLLGYELSSVVALQALWHAALCTQALPDSYDLAGCSGARAVNCHALSGVLIEHRQTRQPPPVCGLIVDDIVAPHMVAMRCTDRGGGAHPYGPPLACFLHNL
jgi:hypothetical protein